MEDAKLLNKCFERQVENMKSGIKFVPLEINSIKIVVYTDSAFTKNSIYTSKIGFVIVLAEKNNRAKIIQWSSIKCRRVTRGVLADELYGLAQGFDMGTVIKSTAEKILELWHLDHSAMIVCTNSKSLYNCPVKIGIT